MLYSHIFNLSVLSTEPIMGYVFFDENDNLLDIFYDEKQLLVLNKTNPLLEIDYLVGKIFSGSTVIEVLPIAMSKNGKLVMFVRMIVRKGFIVQKTTISESSMKEVHAICLNKIKDRSHTIPVQETRASGNLGFRLFIHRKIIKPIYYFFSNHIVNREIINYVKSLGLNEKSLICDVACGYDTLATDIARQYNSTVLLNDTVNKPLVYRANKNLYSKEIFTNENVLELDILHKADLLICKNILHHMTLKEDLGTLMNKLTDLSKVLVIVDPEKPMTSILGKLWNFYYKNFLLDQGREFIDFNTFENLVNSKFPKAKIITKKVKTVKGYFMLSFIDTR